MTAPWFNRSVVKIEAIVAVNVETNTRLTNIQMTAITRPLAVCGDTSPYPTVVIVTADHQRAEAKPLAARPPPPNCAGFARRSQSQIRRATNPMAPSKPSAILKIALQRLKSKMTAKNRAVPGTRDAGTARARLEVK